MCANNSSLFNKIFFKAYALAWRVATPFLGRHKRLQDGFAQRFAPAGWAKGYACGQLFAKGFNKDFNPEAATQPSQGSVYLQKQNPEQNPAKNSNSNFAKTAVTTIWAQAASGGEAYLLVKLWQELRQSYQGDCDLKILATTCTRQGMEVLCRAKAHVQPLQGGEVELCPQYFPFDAPSIIERAMREASPALLVLMETELWPALLQEAHRRDVPVVVLNGRLTPKAFKHYRLLPATFWRSLAPQHILATSKADAGRFASLFSLSEVALLPNLKFDLLAPSLNSEKTVNSPQVSQLTSSQVPSQAGPQAAPQAALEPVQPPIVLFSSVRKEEADLLAEAISLLQKMNLRCPIIVAPRHLHHVPLWQQALAKRNIQSKLACSASPNPKADVAALLQHLGLLGPVQGGLGEAALPQSPAEQGGQGENKKAASLEKHDQAVPSVSSFASGPVSGPVLLARHSDEVIIWNRFGDLKELYALAEAVFVGGTLAPLGGQNFLEALAEGAQPCLGPHIDNFAWAKEAALEFCTFVNTPQELARALAAKLAGNHESRAEVKANFAEYVQKNSGGAAQAAKLLQRLLARE